MHDHEDHHHSRTHVEHGPRRGHEGHGHAHGHAHFGSGKRMGVVLALTSGLMIAEFVAGWLSHSLALMADAGHMLSDVAAQVLAMMAMWIAARPANRGKSFGYYRTEILASLLNGVLLVGISCFIIWESFSRLMHPPEVEGGIMLVIAAIGVTVNLISMRLLRDLATDSLNVKAAYLELFGDMIASAGVLVAAMLIYFTRWYIVDPLISVLIGFLILPRTWLLLSECTNILMEGTPGHIDLDKLHTALMGVPNVTNVHDIHVWTITSGFDAMCAHVQVTSADVQSEVLAEVTRVTQKDFNIGHTTIQIELPGFADES